MSEISIEEAGARLTVDLAAIAANYSTLAKAAPGAECAAVVKADAYGLGARAVVPALYEAGARTFFVAHPAEARAIAPLAPGAAIYVLNGLAPGAASVTAEIGARPVLCTRADVADWAAHCRAAGRKLPAALHVDTGMNRLGLSREEAAALAAETSGDLSRFELSLLMSHFVSSELEGDALNGAQIAAFDELRKLFPDVPASLANSSGIFLAEKPHYDMVRPGYALYGGNPLPGRDNPMRAVVTLEARIVQTRNLSAGDTVGYNAQWTASGACTIAIVSTGYADGYPRAAAGLDGKAGSIATVNGARCPVVGRISMDLLAVDVTACPKPPERGGFVELLGSGYGIDDFAEAAGTIGYEILTRLGNRFARVYKDAD